MTRLSIATITVLSATALACKSEEEREAEEAKAALRRHQEMVGQLGSLPTISPPVLFAAGQSLGLQQGVSAEGVADNTGRAVTCPELASAESSTPQDEFDRRAGEAALPQAKAACRDRLAAYAKASLPAAGVVAIYAVTAKLELKGDYDFSSQEFRACSSTAVKFRDDLGVGLGCLGWTCSVVVTGFEHPSVGSDGESWACLDIPVPESQGKAMKQRLESARNLRAEVAYETPLTSGPSGLTYGNMLMESQLSGITASGVAYRILDDSGVIEPWTAVAPDKAW